MFLATPAIFQFSPFSAQAKVNRCDLKEGFTWVQMSFKIPNLPQHSQKEQIHSLLANLIEPTICFYNYFCQYQDKSSDKWWVGLDLTSSCNECNSNTFVNGSAKGRKDII